MKNTYTSKRLSSYIFISVIGILIFWSCQNINPFEDLKLIVNTDIYKSPILIEFKNANSNSETIPTDLTVTITGTGKQYVLNEDGGKDFSVSGGILKLVLDKNVTPTQNNPINFTVSVTSSNFASNSTSLTITDAQSPISLTVPLASITEPPKGAVALIDNISFSSGKSISIPSTLEKPESANLKIESGTQVFDENGGIINSNEVKAQLIQFGTSSEESMICFPGGYTQNTIQLKDGTTSAGTFSTAGFLSIEMEANGRKVKSFSKPIDANIEVNPSQINPETNQKWKVGDKISTWSYDSNTSIWKEEGTATIMGDVNGKLFANFKISHLSQWSINYNYSKQNSCQSTFNLKVKSNIFENIVSERFLATTYLFYASNPYREINSMKVGFNSLNGSDNYYTGWFPNGTKAQMIVVDKINGVHVGVTDLFNPCTTKEVPITMNVGNSRFYLETDAEITIVCKNKNIEIKPTRYIQFYDKIDKIRFYSYIRDGKFKTVLAAERTYDYLIEYDNNKYSGTIVVGKDGNAVVTSNVTSQILSSSKSTIDLVTKKLTLNLKYQYDNCK